MRKILMLAVLAAAVCAFAAPKKCDFDKAMRNFEKRMDMNMSGSKVTKNIASDPEGVSVVQKLSKPIRSGQYMGLRQYLVYGFIKSKRNAKLFSKADVPTCKDM